MGALKDRSKSPSRGCASVLHRWRTVTFFSQNYYGKGCFSLFAQPFIQPAPNKVCDTTCTVPRDSLSRPQFIITWLELFLAYVKNCASPLRTFCCHTVTVATSIFFFFFLAAYPFFYKTSAISLPTKHQFSSILS